MTLGLPMASAVRVEVTGVEQVATQFKLLGLKAKDLSPAFARISSQVATNARATAPKVTGRLAADIRPSKGKTRASVAVGRASVPYAGPINYGWRKRNISPTLFMNKAANDHVDESVDEITKEMQRQIDAVGLDG